MFKFFKKKNKEESGDLYKNIIIILLLLLSGYFIVSISNNRNSYKEEISALEHIKDSLEQRLNNSIPKDSLLFYLNEQEVYSDIINTLNDDIENLKKRYEEKDIMDVHSLFIDDNIKLLSKFLSEKTDIGR